MDTIKTNTEEQSIQERINTLKGEIKKLKGKESSMAKKKKIKITKPAGKKKMGKAMGEFKKGTLKSSSGQAVTNPKQAIAIGLSEADEAQKKKKKRILSSPAQKSKSKWAGKKVMEIHGA